MNDIELNAILYYADFLSLKHSSTTVTDNCKYYYIHGTPINSAYIVGNMPVYDETNKYFIQSKSEYNKIKDKFGEDGANAFVNGVCNLNAIGVVNATQMLQVIHRYTSANLRNKAFAKYKNQLENLKYHTTKLTDTGDEIEVECTRYVAHANAKKSNKRPELYTGRTKDNKSSKAVT